MSWLWMWPSGGWDFDEWRSARSRPPSITAQSGRATFTRLAPPGADRDAWRDALEGWRVAGDALLGSVACEPPRAPDWAVVERREIGGLPWSRIHYALTAGGERGAAWLHVPEGVGAAAAIALHQTVPQGKDEPVGLDGDPELAYGLELARCGWAVLAPDAIAFGERRGGKPLSAYDSAAAFFGANPDGSGLARMAFDVSRAVDVLETVPAIRRRAIACIGHSHGGYGTLFAMAREPRIRAGAISCAITAYRTDPTPERWWRMTCLLPRLGLYEGAMEETPLDFHAWLALCAPRPLFVSAALSDRIFPETESVRRLLRHARGAWSGLGAPGALQSYVFEGEHRFPRRARAAAYRLLESATAG